MSLTVNNVSGKGINHNPVPLELNFGQGGSLPIDLFPRIFQDLKVDLPSVALVCKNWKALADDESISQNDTPCSKLLALKNGKNIWSGCRGRTSLAKTRLWRYGKIWRPAYLYS